MSNPSRSLNLSELSYSKYTHEFYRGALLGNGASLFRPLESLSFFMPDLPGVEQVLGF